jgi:heme a synthase
MFKVSISWYNKLVRGTLVVIYLLIIAGGVVRCTGSGMGCPDWPRCFGRWVPPTSISELPPNYLELYPPKGNHNADFNVYKTWTEYLNRLLGAISGLMVLGCFGGACMLKNRKDLIIISALALLLIIFQGWLGAKVVSTNLAPYMITIHMFFALIIVGVLIYSLLLSSELKAHKSLDFNTTLLNLSLLVLVTTFAQILLGTQVRKEVDIVSAFLNYQQRELWVERLGINFLVHRSFSLVVLFLNLYYVKLLFSSFHEAGIRRLAIVNLSSILLIIISGVCMNYFNIPSWIQPIHLSLSSIIFGVQFYLFVHLYSMNNAKHLVLKHV